MSISNPNLWRLNVRSTQVKECIQQSLFAIDSRPRNPPLHRGDYLLLQLVKSEADASGRSRRRIEFALVFDRLLPDPDGSISRTHWPHAGKVWRWIVECSKTVPVVGMSLEHLRLSKDYSGQSNPQFIEPHDAAQIWPFVTHPHEITSPTPDLLLGALQNWDRVIREGPERVTTVREHERRILNPFATDILKVMYDHRCQICEHDFKPRWGVPLAETRLLQQSGEPVSTNLIVLCPNHDAIIGKTRAEFDRSRIAFLYPNGLIERVAIDRHIAA